MAKYSAKMMGKEVGSAEVYAEPHTMSGKATNVQTYSVTLDFISTATAGIPTINILNKLPVKPRNVVIGSILRKDGVEIPGTPQITWTPDGRNIKILTIGGLVADTAYTATFNYSL